MTFFASKKPPFVKTTSSNDKNGSLFYSEVPQRISLIFDQNHGLTSSKKWKFFDCSKVTFVSSKKPGFF